MAASEGDSDEDRLDMVNVLRTKGESSLSTAMDLCAMLANRSVGKGISSFLCEKYSVIGPGGVSGVCDVQRAGEFGVRGGHDRVLASIPMDMSRLRVSYWDQERTECRTATLSQN